MTPLVIKVFLTWLINVYVYHSLAPSDQALAAAAGLEKPHGVGYGVGLAFVIVGMQGSFCPFSLVVTCNLFTRMS